MTIHDLIERRAEEGDERGAANVWADAMSSVESRELGGGARSANLFRLALALWIVGLVAVVLVRPDSATTRGDVVPASDAQDNAGPVQSDEPLPAPLLIDGATLKRRAGGVTRPFDPDFDAGDLFDGILGETFTQDLAPNRPSDPTTTVFFARPTNPFDGPILGLQLFDGGGFRPWGANLGDTPLTDFTRFLEQGDNDWSIAADSGLVEVARFQDDSWDSLKYGWQFDFEGPGNDEVTLQAETTEADRVLSEWVWLARLGGPDRPATTVRSVQVLGRDGFAIDSGGTAARNVIWSSDRFVYRMTAARIEGNRSVSRDATSEIDRLRVVERSVWVDAIAASTRTSTSQSILGALQLLVLIALFASTMWFLAKRSFRAAALASVLAASVFFTRSPIYLGILPLAVLGLANAWWLHRSQK